MREPVEIESEEEEEMEESEEESEEEPAEPAEPLEQIAKLPVPSAVGTMIGSFLDLAPGVPATESILRAVLGKLTADGFLLIFPQGEAPHPNPVANLLFTMHPAKRRVPAYLTVTMTLWTKTDPIYERRHPPTTAGLRAALADGKAARENLKRGFCAECRAEIRNRLLAPRRLKVTGLEMCEYCVVVAAVRV
jgi:hypothetical protein